LEEDVKLTCTLKRALFDTSNVEKGHGIIETRRCEVFEKGYSDEKRWLGVKSVIKITSIRELSNKSEIQELAV
jgi:hypothetical protein